MRRVDTIRHEFVEYVPEQPQEGVLYVSVAYRTALHLCCCGCGTEVATPFSPADWQVTFDGETVSLYPSIGNWGLRCRSHYWIREDRVDWARSWTQKEIAFGRARDRVDAELRFRRDDSGAFDASSRAVSGLWERILRRFSWMRD